MTNQEYIRAYQLRHKLTNPALASLVSYSPRSVDHWRSGDSPVPQVVVMYLRIVELVQERYPDTWAEFVESNK